MHDLTEARQAAQEMFPYLKTHAIANIAWNDVTCRMFARQTDAGLELRNLKTLFGHSLVTGKTVITDNPASDPRSAYLPQGHPPMLSYLGIPQAIGGKLIARVAVASTPGGSARRCRRSVRGWPRRWRRGCRMRGSTCTRCRT